MRSAAYNIFLAECGICSGFWIVSCIPLFKTLPHLACVLHPSGFCLAAILWFRHFLEHRSECPQIQIALHQLCSFHVAITWASDLNERGSRNKVEAMIRRQDSSCLV